MNIEKIPELAEYSLSIPLPYLLFIFSILPCALEVVTTQLATLSLKLPVGLARGLGNCAPLPEAIAPDGGPLSQL